MFSSVILFGFACAKVFFLQKNDISGIAAGNMLMAFLVVVAERGCVSFFFATHSI